MCRFLFPLVYIWGYCFASSRARVKRTLCGIYFLYFKPKVTVNLTGMLALDKMGLSRIQQKPCFPMSLMSWLSSRAKNKYGEIWFMLKKERSLVDKLHCNSSWLTDFIYQTKIFIERSLLLHPYVFLVASWKNLSSIYFCITNSLKAFSYQ